MIYEFCPRCGGKLNNIESNTPKCGSCDFVFYKNSVPAFGAMIVNDQGQVLLAKRAYNPEKGKWDLPGGFLEYGEEAEDALVRELDEELGIKVEEFKLLDSEIGDYLFQGIDFKTLNLFFLVTKYSGEIVPADDVAEVVWFNKDEIPTEGWAFNWITRVIKRWKKN